MFNTHDLMARLLPCCRTGADDGAVQALLDRRNIGILSAACCDAGGASKDEALRQNLEQAMQQSGDTRPVAFATITAAQQRMRSLEAGADAGQKQLVGTVMALFQAHGLAIFPLLIVDGRVATFGGVPSASLIVERLQRQPLTAAAGA